MLVVGLVAATLTAGTGQFPVRLAMAAALIAANGQNRYEPPSVEEVPPPSVPPRSGTVPAPVPQQTVPDNAVVPTVPGVPVPRALPAPITGSEQRRMAQTEPSANEITQRLDRLEQENQRLRQELEAAKKSGDGSPSAGVRSPSSLNPSQAPAQMVNGWRVSLYPWNADAFVSDSPLVVFNIRNQRFDATLGQRPYDRSRLVERRQRATNEMFVYRFEGWLHVTRAGHHEIGFDVNFGFDHPCNLIVKVGGVQVINIQRQNLENKLLVAGLDLEQKDYPIEITFGLAHNRFIKFDPSGQVRLYPLYRPPGEYNLRDFRPGELLTEASPSVPYGPPAR